MAKKREAKVKEVKFEEINNDDALEFEHSYVIKEMKELQDGEKEESGEEEEKIWYIG